VLALAISAAGYLARPGWADEPKLPRLIEAARGLAETGARVERISRGLLDARYVHEPLGGGPRRREQLTLREDGFDCVTFVETALAAARVRSFAAFADAVRTIRYRDGEIGWFTRNHYFVLWALNNSAAGTVRPVWLPGAIRVAKTLTYMHSLPPVPVAFTAVPRERLLAHSRRLATGDIAAFVSRRPGIDVFHAGFVIVDADGGLHLRHASRSRGRVVEQPLAQFMAENGVRQVALWRPQELGAVDAIV
jgi:hypothetical protein